MSARSIVSPEDQRVTFIELFFDLVFVFCVTQVVALLHDGFTWAAVGQAILVFWLVWWGWTQFTWALNAADTTHHVVELATLFATAVAFFMAVALPDAFHGGAAAFAIPYVLGRVIGLLLYGRVASAADPSQHAAVRTFSLVSIGGLAAVLIGGLSSGVTQYELWGLAILLDLIAAAIGGRQEGWNLHPEHFAERHALFVIIALGETLIVAAAGLTGATWTPRLLAVAVLAVAITGGLWWTYFARAKRRLDHALESCRGTAQSEMGRDVFSLMHFPMLCGIIAYAAVIEQAMTHPADPLSTAARTGLAIGLTLFVGGMTACMWRATRHLMRARLIVMMPAAIALVALGGTSPVLVLAVAFAAILAIAVWEQRAPDDAEALQH